MPQPDDKGGSRITINCGKRGRAENLNFTLHLLYQVFAIANPNPVPGISELLCTPR